jgi:hypothetical protein
MFTKATRFNTSQGLEVLEVLVLKNIQKFKGLVMNISLGVLSYSYC